MTARERIIRNLVPWLRKASDLTFNQAVDVLTRMPPEDRGRLLKIRLECGKVKKPFQARKANNIQKSMGR